MEFLGDTSNIFVCIFVITHCTVSGKEWVFQQIIELRGLYPVATSSYLYKTSQTGGLASDCFQYCVMYEKCNVVITTANDCYSSIYPVRTVTYKINADYYSDHTVYFKRPTGVCQTNGYIYYKEFCYKRGTDRTWEDANTDCKLTGGQLASLDNEEKFNITIELFSEIVTGNDYFVGASDLESEGQWRWISNNAGNYFRFMNGQPNNVDIQHVSYSADCGVLRINAKHGEMFDDYCVQPKHYICELL